MDEFENELNRPPATRREHTPNPLVGRLVSRFTFDGGEFEPAEVLVIQPDGDDTAISVLCGRATLRSFVERSDPRVGDTVGIKFAGEVIRRKAGKAGKK